MEREASFGATRLFLLAAESTSSMLISVQSITIPLRYTKELALTINDVGIDCACGTLLGLVLSSGLSARNSGNRHPITKFAVLFLVHCLASLLWWVPHSKKSVPYVRLGV